MSDESGVKQGTISKIERSGGSRTSFIVKLADALELSPAWIESGHGAPYSVAEGVPAYDYAGEGIGRSVPVIDDTRAGDWQQIVGAQETNEQVSALQLDGETAQRYGPAAFALRITGSVMIPVLEPGDFVIIDPDQPPQPGDYVAAQLEHSSDATVRRYRDRGRDESGYHCFELVPANEDYPVIRVNAANPGAVIGPVVEHRRMFR